MGVAESRTRLGDFTFIFHFHALEKEMATHSSVLAWRIPGTGEPSGLLSMGSHRIGHDWSDLAAAACGQWIFVLKQRRPSCTGTGFRLLFKCQQVAKSKLPFQKLQHGKHVGILLVGGKMVHLTYDSWKTGIKRSWPFLSFKAWRTLPSRGGRQSCWNMSFVVLNGVRRLHLHKARRMARFSE